MPHRFARRWLSYDQNRPARPRLARQFAVALLAMLALAGLLAWLTAR
jgi:hypothetical protein